MSEIESAENALNALTSGAFHDAAEVYGELLEMSPENPEYACGYYTSGYWENRDELFHAQRPGKNSAYRIIEEWEKFQAIAEERDYLETFSYRAAMQKILGEAAHQFRTAFQEEGGTSVDIMLLTDLGKTLLRIGNHQDAIDILQYAKRITSPDPTIYFLLGEAMAASEKPELLPTALSLYRDAFFLNPEAMNPALVCSPVASSVFLHLYTKLFPDNMEKTILWFPAYLHARSMGPGLRRLQNEECDRLKWETDQLEKELPGSRFEERIRARLAFYYLAIIYHHLHHDLERDTVRSTLDLLKQGYSDLFLYYQGDS